jgi:hypothetical protein
MAAMMKDWEQLNDDTKIAWLQDALFNISEKDYYELPNDVTVTGKRYFIERMDFEVVAGA